jgi:glutamyl-tRNA reductase
LSAAAPTITEAVSARIGRLVVVGRTFRDGTTLEREAAAVQLGQVAGVFDERLVLHTCHRAELVGLLRADADPPVIPGTRLRVGADAVEHTLLVAGGLDSAVLAEEQVLGQLREAYQTALARGETGPVLNELLRRALRFGKLVRAEARPGADRSLAELAVRWLTERLGRAAGATALVIGSGETGRLLAAGLATRGIAVTAASRSLRRARDVVSSLPQPGRHRATLLADVLDQAAGFDVVAVAVRSAATPLEARHLRVGSTLPLVVDLSSPPGVTPEAAALLAHRLVDLDRIGRADAGAALGEEAERRLRSLAAAERDRFIAWFGARASGDGIAALREHAAEIRQRHLDRLRRRAGLDADQLAAVETMTAAMMGELLHLPTIQLRHDPEAAAQVRRVFGIDR